MTLEDHARNIRTHIIKAGYAGAYAHFGGSLSAVDIMAVLFGTVMNFHPGNKNQKDRDRFILSKGHCALALYAALFEFGFIHEEQLLSFNRNGGDFPTHCVKNSDLGIELSSGSLGLGLSFGIGQALALKDMSRVFVLAGNGETNEGSFWEAIMLAGSMKLKNICLIVDNNSMQNDGHSDTILSPKYLDGSFRSFGWEEAHIDGHSVSELKETLMRHPAEKPLVIVAHTVKGKGISFMENHPDWHHNRLSEELYQQAMQECGVKS